MVTFTYCSNCNFLWQISFWGFVQQNTTAKQISVSSFTLSTVISMNDTLTRRRRTVTSSLNGKPTISWENGGGGGRYFWADI